MCAAINDWLDSCLIFIHTQSRVSCIRFSGGGQKLANSQARNDFSYTIYQNLCVLASSRDTYFDWVFSNRVLCTRLHPHRLRHYCAFVFSAYGGKIHAARSAGGR